MMKTFHRVTTPRAFTKVVEQIKEGILNGDLGPGTMLPSEQTLTTEFGVSRTVIREALRTLEQMGLCHMIQGAAGGALITLPSEKVIAESLALIVRLSPERLQEVVEARLLVEREVAGLAASRASDSEIRSLKDLVQEMDTTREKNVDAYCEADYQSHIVLATASHNFLLENMMKSISHVLHELIMDLSQIPDLRAYGVMHHRALVSAIENRNPDAAKLVIGKMLSAPIQHNETIAVRQPHCDDL